MTADERGFQPDNRPEAKEVDESDAAAAPLSRPLVRCNKCGYDLNGLTIGEFCPECGHQIGSGFGDNAPTSGAAITSLVLGILAVVSCIFYGLPALLLGGIAVVFSVSAKRQVLAAKASPNSLAFSKAGFVLGIVGMALGVVYILFFVAMVVFISGGGSWP